MPTAAAPKSTKDSKQARHDQAFDVFLYGDPAQNRLPVLPRTAYPELQNGYYASRAATLHNLYLEMEEKDGNIWGICEQRRQAVLSRDQRLLPASDTPRDVAIAAWAEKALEQIEGPNGGFSADLADLLYALFTGLSVLEIDWQPQRLELNENAQAELGNRTDYILPRELLHRFPGNFVFDRMGQMFLDHGATRRDAVQPRKYLRHVCGGHYENPYGAGLFQHVWWFYYFKKSVLRSWLVACDKHGTPTTVLKHPNGYSEEQCNRLVAIIDQINTDTGFVIPEDIQAELLEAAHNGGSPHAELMAYCDNAIARAVVGSTLTSGEGERSGSLALGKVHLEVARDKIEQDAKALAWVVNRQLLRWMIDINFGAEIPAPLWKIDTSEPGDAKHDLDVARELLGMGVRIPTSYFYERFLIPQPNDDEPFLSHDDQDVFQYHMQFGVLTINEARYRLGLPPVPWGEAPVNTGQAPTGTPPASEEDPRRGDPRQGDPAERAEMAELFRDGPHEYASTQITVPLDHARDIQRFQQEIPEEEIHEMGIETDIHITARYGLIEPTDAPEATLQQLQQALADTPPLRIACGRLNRFQAPDYDVLYIEVLSPDLHRLHRTIGEATRHHDTHPEYTPHITVAYLQPGEAAKYVGDDRFRWLEFSTRELIYSDTQGRKSVVELRGPEPEGQNMAEDPRRGVAAMTHETNSLIRALLAEDPPDTHDVPEL